MRGLAARMGTASTAPTSPRRATASNPNKLLLDPYAHQHVGELSWDPAVFGYVSGETDLTFDKRDSAPFMPKSRVIDAAFTWGTDRTPRVSWERTIFYETHVRGFTMRHPAVPENLRGTFSGMRTREVVDYVRSLGVTSVELLPVHAFVDDDFLIQKGRRNYWGYNTIGFFAPQPRYMATPFRERIQGDGGAVPRCRSRGHPRRRLQPHRRGQRDGPRPYRSRASTTHHTTG